MLLRNCSKVIVVLAKITANLILSRVLLHSLFGECKYLTYR